MTSTTEYHEEPLVHLVSSEGELFTVKKEIATMSTTIQSSLELESDASTEISEIPLPTIKSAVLVKVIEFCEHYKVDRMKEIEKPLRSNVMNEIVDEWYATFIEVEQELFFELISAANYLDITPLLDLASAKVASMIKGRTPEEIRRQFSIVNDFTPEEEAQVMEENKWAEEA